MKYQAATFLLLGVFFLIAGPLAGQDALLPEYLTAPGGEVAAVTSDADFGYAVADDFTPAADGTIRFVRWRGGYLDFGLGLDCGPGPGDHFIVTYFLDDGSGRPGPVAAGPFEVGVTSRKWTGHALAGIVDEWEFFSSDHPPVTVVGGQKYWLEIQNDTYGDGDCAWQWSTTNAGNGTAIQNGMPAPYDLAFANGLKLQGGGRLGLLAPAANDDCANAIGPLAVPSTTPGTTVDATAEAGPPPDCGTSLTTGGVWYTVTGTGNTMTASMCNGMTGYDAKLSVYCGGCADPTALVCVTGIDDFCGLQPEVSWCSEAGTLYRILVHGFGGATGSFELVITDDGAPCAGAVACPVFRLPLRFNSSRCFVATAAYGDEDAPEVRVLRSWRDESLSSNALGRQLVKAYYAASPPLAEAIAENPVARVVSRAVLAPVVGAVKLWLEASWLYGLAGAVLLLRLLRRKRA